MFGVILLFQAVHAVACLKGSDAIVCTQATSHKPYIAA